MFDSSDTPRLFGLPCGVDFGQALVAGLRDRLAGQPPEAMARVEVIVNTNRMARRLTTLFDAAPAGFLPRIRLITHLAPPAPRPDLPRVSTLARRLELLELVRGLLDRQPDFAPRSAAFDLASSVAGLMEEMQGEGLTPDVLDQLDVSDQSGHWQRALSFLSIAGAFFDVDAACDPAAEQRRAAEALAAHWASAPPDHPILIAGSTGSRGTARLLMEAVARLPQGAVILPGVDTTMPAHAWAALRKSEMREEHPQFRILDLADALGIAPGDIRGWTDAVAPSQARNALVSLALRPAPTTFAWRDEGPRLSTLDEACSKVTLIEAPSLRDEALTIALKLREVAETSDRTAALITPDRKLTRLVAALLDQWGITPDDSAGIPLNLTPPGRLLRHVAELMGERLTAERLLILLKHPLCHSGARRNDHLRLTRDLELALRRNGPPFPDAETLRGFAGAHKDAWATDWAEWLIGALPQPCPDKGDMHDLARWIARHRASAERLCAGTEQTGSGQLWVQMAGVSTLDVMDRLAEAAVAGGAMTAVDYLTLFSSILAAEQQRDRDAGDPRILIWGTLEARVMGADVLILGGLNEGSWPEAPSPDPWLNRAMRKDAGLLLPERRIGLSAHDFQQAIGAPEVWLTRAIRNDGAETVPSRWLNRITNLLAGLSDEARDTLAGMRNRGQRWLETGRAFERVTPGTPAPRPAPRPPLAAKPAQLSVTAMKTLARDPYAIYARHTLRLKPLDPLAKTPDAAMRGTVIHDALEDVLRASDLSRAAFLRQTAARFEADVPWPETRVIWQARMARIADDFLSQEAERQALATPARFETPGRSEIPHLDFALTAKADRFDIDGTGGLYLYDYKTGQVPTEKQQKTFDKQLLLMAAMAEAGAFRDVPKGPVRQAQFIKVGLDTSAHDAPLDEVSTGQTWAELLELIEAMQSPDFSFTARRAMMRAAHGGDYDQLARFGEWDTTDTPSPEDLT